VIAAAARLLAAVALLCSAPASAQSALERPPNLHGGWTGTAGVLHFNFVHRFNHSGPPERQVQNRPTFLMAGSPMADVLAGVHYTTRSALRARSPNEWEPFARMSVLTQGENAPADAAVQLSWNSAASSLDGELALNRRFGAVRVLSGTRVLSRDAAASAVSVAVLGGAVIRLHEQAAIAADAVRRLRQDARTAWGVAIQLRVPTTPHTLSLHATNVDATTSHSASFGADRVRWGFEFTVPVTPARYRTALRAQAIAAPTTSDDSVTVRVRMHNLAYAPDTIRIRAGTVVAWHNEDPLPHTVTAVDGSWDSGEIAPGQVWRYRFDRPGRFDIICTPHPFMRAVLIVQ
jgi:plastocyanin